MYQTDEVSSSDQVYRLFILEVNVGGTQKMITEVGQGVDDDALDRIQTTQGQGHSRRSMTSWAGR